MEHHVTSSHRNLNAMENSYKIMLIDDDPICHMINTRLLKRFSSSTIETFTDPIEALKQLTWRAMHEPEKFPDSILLDIDMPRMNGWQFLEEFHKLPADVVQRASIMMLSSSNHSTDIERSKQYTIVKKFFSKPLTVDMVKAITSNCN